MLRNLKLTVWTLLAGVGLSITGPLPVMADDRGPLGDLLSYIRVANPKAELIARTVSLGDRVRKAERRGDLRPSEGRDLSRRISRVRDFLRDDRKLSDSEFRRRDGDLDKIERDLERKRDRGRDRYERDRYDRDRYERDRR